MRRLTFMVVLLLALLVELSAVAVIGPNAGPSPHDPGDSDEVISRSCTVANRPPANEVISRGWTVVNRPPANEVISRAYTVELVCQTGACCLRDSAGNFTLCSDDVTEGECDSLAGVHLGGCSECPIQNAAVVAERGGVFIHVIGPPVDCLPGGHKGRTQGVTQGGPYIDAWTSPADGKMCQLFGVPGSPPIPAGFFDETSDEFTGSICLEGVPLGDTPFGHFDRADTLIQRTDDPFDRCALPSDTAVVVGIEVVALSLAGTSPITVTHDNGQNPEQWMVAVDLSDIPAPPGTLTARKLHCNGGTYTSHLNVQARFTFTKASDPNQVRVLDTGQEGIDPVELDQGEPAPWVGDLDENFGLEGAPNSSFHAGVEESEPSTECDCNENEVRDKCDIETEASGDCNDNGVPDECDISEGTSVDTNENGIPDECDFGDCIMDGVVDLADFIIFRDCVTAPGHGVVPGCECADLDGDRDADLLDFAVFQSRFSRP